jgi:osmotically-inducible protein OsmY
MATLEFFTQKDAHLEETIEQAIRARGKHPAVQVVVRDGYVNLLGSVDSLEEKRAIGAMVETIPGVQIVTNHIRPKTWQEKRTPGHF